MLLSQTFYVTDKNAIHYSVSILVVVDVALADMAVIRNPLTTAAMPRQIERVPGGAEFGLNLVVNIWEQDNNEEELMRNLFKSLKLLKDDYLGGHGSRGYGQISFEIADVHEKSTVSFYSQSGVVAKSIKEKYKAEIESLHQN